MKNLEIFFFRRTTPLSTTFYDLKVTFGYIQGF